MRIHNVQFPILIALAVTLAAVTAAITRPVRSLPTDPSSRTTGFADEQRCAACHDQAASFAQTGHARTLRRAVDPSSVALLQQLLTRRPELANGLSLEVQPETVVVTDQVTDQVSPPARRLELDWCFGSGTHASTWVGTLADSWGATDLVEFRWTWYAQQQQFDLTPGQPSAGPPGYFEHLGVLFDAPKARRCFGCHSTCLPVEHGEILETQIHPGVTCQRCHGPQATHVASEGQHAPPSLKELSQTEAIRHCAQCHRSTEDRDIQDISPDNPEIARFQPIGLTHSQCFLKSPTLRCTTCHDPHRPLSAQDSAGSWQCRQCHDPARTDHVLCAAGHKERCVACHMPKVRGAAPVAFTDHWIRVRHNNEADE